MDCILKALSQCYNYQSGWVVRLVYSIYIYTCKMYTTHSYILYTYILLYPIYLVSRLGILIFNCKRLMHFLFPLLDIRQGREKFRNPEVEKNTNFFKKQSTRSNQRAEKFNCAVYCWLLYCIWAVFGCSSDRMHV